MAARLPGSVLIVTESDDPHVAVMAATLREDHAVNAIHLDLRDFPRERGSFRLHRFGTARAVSHLAGLDEVRSVWWRAPASRHRTRGTECDSFLEGLLWSIPAVWINDPAADSTATRAIVQLETAQRAGCAVPETLITNDADDARAFVESRPGPVVYRSGVEADFVDLDRLADPRSAPIALQDHVPPRCDLRVVWVDGIEWTVRRDAITGPRRVDSRRGRSIPCLPDKLPASVSKSLATLMGALGLSFGVLTLRLGLDGEYYFLEVDPRGHFAHLEIETGLPLFRSLGNLLVRGDGTVPDDRITGP